MKDKFRYIVVSAVIIITLGVASYFIQDRHIPGTSLPPFPNSPEAERNYKFKLPPPDPSRSQEELRAIQQEMAAQVLRLFDEEEISIVAIGDSLTQGVGDETEQGGYVGLLDRLLTDEQQTVSFTNLGKRGNRSDQLLERLQEAEVADALEGADLILITIGANDLMKIARENMMHLQLHDFIEERANYAKRLQEIFNQIRMINSDAHIYLIGFYNPFEKYFPHIKELEIIIEEYSHTGVTIVNRMENSSYIPVRDLFQDSNIELFADDQFHPNYSGYERIATRVLEYILLAGGIGDEKSN